MKEATPRDRRTAADKVEALFGRMVSDGLIPDTIAQNTVLNALVCSEAYARAEALFAHMLTDERTPPNDRTFTIMMHMHSERKQQHKVSQDLVVFYESRENGHRPKISQVPTGLFLWRRAR